MKIGDTVFHDARLGAVRLDPAARRLTLRLERLRKRIDGPDPFAGTLFDAVLEFRGGTRASGLFDLPALADNRGPGNVEDLSAGP